MRKGAVAQTAAQRPVMAADGPCAGCQARIIRYGSSGHALCVACNAGLFRNRLRIVANDH